MLKMEIIHKSQNPSLLGPTRYKGEDYKMWTLWGGDVTISFWRMEFKDDACSSGNH